MREQRRFGTIQAISQEFSYSRREEEIGMRDSNASHGNDFLATTGRIMDHYELNELEPSWCTQLDTIGMQPHAREYLDRSSTCLRSERQLQMIQGQMIDYSSGIHFDGMP
jgi:hypothetical protein